MTTPKLIGDMTRIERRRLVVSTDPNYDTRFVAWDSVEVRPDIRRAWNSDGTPIIVEDGE